MRAYFQLAAIFFLTAAATTRAQITDPNNLIAPPPPPIQFHGKHLIKPVTDFQWLWQYTQPQPIGNETALIADPHFPAFLQDNLKAPQSFYRDGALSLSDVASKYFATLTHEVRSQDNRYISFGGCIQTACTSHGLIWVDTAVQHPTVVFAATEWTTEGKPIDDPDAQFNLWLFTSRTFDVAHPPPALVTAIGNWNAQHIATALVIDPDGTPHKINPAVLGATAAPTK
jgi:hypothetical protein